MANTTKYNHIHYLVSMLKAYGIKNIIASPGIQNAYFNAIVQNDDYFKCYSEVDERNNAYMALGISYETNEPVAISCTESNASTNFLPAMREAFYRNIPIVAITFFGTNRNEYNLSPQYANKKSCLSDVCEIDVTLLEQFTDNEKETNLTFLNATLANAKYNHYPVHINCPSCFNFDEINNINQLPDDIWTNEFIFENFIDYSTYIESKNTVIFIGSHKKFSKEEIKEISEFAEKYSTPVICDHSSNYQGKNKILLAQYQNMINPDNYPQLIIDMGNVCGEYSIYGLFFSNAEIWHIADDFKFKSRLNRPITKTFMCKEKQFFKELNLYTPQNCNFYNNVKEEINKIVIPELPLCNALIGQYLARYIPDKSSLHIGVSNTKRSTNFTTFNNSITTNMNVGMCGIDGVLPTAIGQSFADNNRKVFAVMGDLTFFYGVNALYNRHINNNLRIILINNGRGEEMRLNERLENAYAENSDNLITAYGHHKNGAKSIANSNNFYYMRAETKEQFLTQINDFCNKEYEEPVLFEVFTNDTDEKNGLNLMQTYNKQKTPDIKYKNRNKIELAFYTLIQQIFNW